MIKPSTLILRRITEITGTAVAKALNKGENKIAKFLANTEGLLFEDFDAFFNTLGLEVHQTSTDNILIPRNELESLRTLARCFLSQPIELKTRAEDMSEAS